MPESINDYWFINTTLPEEYLIVWDGVEDGVEAEDAGKE
jgi:hypothetical protein